MKPPSRMQCIGCLEIKESGEFLNYIKAKKRYYFTDLCNDCFGDDGRDPFALDRFRPRRIVAINNYRTQKLGLVSDLTVEQWVAILEESQGNCHYCKKFVGKDDLVLEHVIPVALGGGTTASNVVASCKHCNWDKGKKLVEALDRVVTEELQQVQTKQADKGKAEQD